MKKRQWKKIIKNDWSKRAIDFINGNKIDLFDALEWIDNNILIHTETAEMSWIHYCRDEDKGYDEGFDYCPDCAEQKIKEEISEGNYKEGELEVHTNSSIEDDGNNRCDTCGVILECSSVGTWIGQEIEHCQQYQVDEGALYEFCNARHSQYFEEQQPEIEDIIIKFFQSGEYQQFVKTNDSVTE